MVADSLLAITQKLRAEGKYPTSVKPASEAAQPILQAGANIRVSRKDVIQIISQLTVMIETGVTISEALDSIAAQSEKLPVRRLMEDLSRMVKSGTDLSSAMSRHSRSFPHVFVALIHASEKSGMLSKLMARGAQYMRDEQEIRGKVKGALTYPSVMFAFALATTCFLLVYVLPKFTAIYASKAAVLPRPTLALMELSAFVTNHYIALPVSMLTAAVSLYFYFHTQSGKRVWDYLQLRVPVAGAMFRKLHLSRSLRTIGTMAGAGVNLMDCVHTAQYLCTNSYYKELWETVAEQIEAGRQFSEPLFHSPLVPRSFAQMLHSAEKSGKLAQVMEQVSTYSEQELKESLTALTRYIEPAMIAGMGLLIGGVSLALLLPIFSISKVVAH